MFEISFEVQQIWYSSSFGSYDFGKKKKKLGVTVKGTVFLSIENVKNGIL